MVEKKQEMVGSFTKEEYEALNAEYEFGKLVRQETRDYAAGLFLTVEDKVSKTSGNPYQRALFKSPFSGLVESITIPKEDGGYNWETRFETGREYTAIWYKIPGTTDSTFIVIEGSLDYEMALTQAAKRLAQQSVMIPTMAIVNSNEPDF